MSLRLCGLAFIDSRNIIVVVVVVVNVIKSWV